MWQENGFLKDDGTDVRLAMQRLTELIELVSTKYKSLSADELLIFPAPNKWSKQQILGHLIDSAINNLKRFTDVQISTQPYIITSYNQDGLMKVNHYQQLPIEHLVTFWQSLNRQIFFVVEQIPTSKLQYEVTAQYDKTGIKTLSWIICDYVAHMEHHLRTISFIS